MSFAPVIDTSARHRAKSSKLPLRRGQSMSNVIGISGSQDTRGLLGCDPPSRQSHTGCDLLGPGRRRKLPPQVSTRHPPPDQIPRDWAKVVLKNAEDLLMLLMPISVTHRFVRVHRLSSKTLS